LAAASQSGRMDPIALALGLAAFALLLLVLEGIERV
jgi:hypothetical protein